jgi:transposase InsO family protein
MSRQNYYKERTRRRKREIDEELVVELVKQERKLQPRIGTRKLHHMLKGKLKDAGVEVGRDRMFKVLGKKGLLVDPLPRSPRTTDSTHSLPVFRNLVSEVEPSGPNQIWVSDITYLRTDEGFEYLSLITDQYSRKIVGYHCGPDLGARGCIEALNGALKDLASNRYPIHHSDRGCQYCCHDYVYRLQARSLPISMTEENHCYENAYAERVNGILKQEYGLGLTFRTRAQARRAVEQAVWIYNHKRPHTSLNMRTPEQVYGQVA